MPHLQVQYTYASGVQVDLSQVDRLAVRAENLSKTAPGTSSLSFSSLC
jgi:hypothetical protein